jgi:hypothetical protein
MSGSSLWSRRHLLRTGALGITGLAAGCVTEDDGFAPSEATPGTASDRPWGEPATDAQRAAMLPESLRPEAIVEHFLSGGVSSFENLCVQPEFGQPGPGLGEQWWAYQEGPDSIGERFASCGTSGDLLQEFGVDSEGRPVSLGPWLMPLRERPDILARMRILIVRHSQVAHQGANPLLLTGLRLGNPRLAGTAAHVQRFFGDRDPDRPTPFAHVIQPRNRHIEFFNGDAGGMLGRHVGSSSPLVTWLGDAQPLSDQLQRQHLLAGSAGHDELLGVWARRMRDRLRPTADQPAVRAPRLDEFDAALRSLEASPSLAELFSDASLALTAGQQCGEDGDADVSAPALSLATRLVNSEEGARYVLAVDGGLIEAVGFLGFDTHGQHVQDSSRNLLWSTAQLADRINRPDETDPGKLDLDRHTVLLSTEFGRTPYRQGSDGTDHWPHGFAVALIGGVIGPEQAGVVGAMDEDGTASDWVTPAQLRASLLLAQGIWPFESEGFAVGDVRSGEHEAEAARSLIARVLGHTL